MSDSQRKQAFINLDLFPADAVMIVVTTSGREYEVQRDERGLWYVYAEHFDESITFKNNPLIAGLGKPAILGPVTTSPVAEVTFLPILSDEDDDDDFTPEPPDDDLPPTGGATVPLIFAIIDLPIRPRFPREWAFLSDGGRLGVVA